MSPVVVGGGGGGGGSAIGYGGKRSYCNESRFLLGILVCILLVGWVPFSSAYQQQAPDPCSVYTNCTQCLYNPYSCGWCSTTNRCYTGSIDGPSSWVVCPNKYFVSDGQINETDVSGWVFTFSTIMNMTDDETNKLSPAYVTVFLRPGIPVPVPVKLVVPVIPPIDFFFLLDASVSMKPYINLLNTLLPTIFSNLTSIVNEARAASGDKNPATVLFGMGSFIEKPVSPFACYPEAHVLNVGSKLVGNTSEVSVALNKLLTNLLNNYEHPENPLEAALIASYDIDNAIGWRQRSFRIILTCTDAGAHFAGDGKNVGIFVPNNNDGVADGFPPGSGEDYPTLSGLRQAFVKNDVVPLLGAINKGGVMVEFYQMLSANLGIGSSVEITSNSQQVVDAILSGTREVLSKAILNIQDDPYDRVDSILPNNGTYLDVKVNETLHFTIIMLARYDQPEYFGLVGLSTVRYVGFGDTVEITSITAVDCSGCALNNRDMKVDICGICGGNDTTCKGCDGQIPLEGQPPLTVDFCGVCGGQNESCVDCFGKLVPPGQNVSQIDLCGVCGGNSTTCLGCDGIPNSGLVVYSPCGRCGAPCDNFQTVVVALASVAVVGLVLAAAAVIFFCTAGAVMAKQDDDINKEEMILHANPLYEEAAKRRENPMYKEGHGDKD